VARIGGCGGAWVFSDIDAFAKFRKAVINFMSGFPSARKSSASTVHWTDFHEIWFFRKSVEEIPVSLHSDKYNGQFTWSLTYIYDNNSILLRMWNSSGRICRGIKTTHFMFNIYFFRKSRCYEICGKLRQIQTTDNNVMLRIKYALCTPGNYGKKRDTLS